MGELAILSSKSSRDFRTWLAENHDRSDGIWLRIFKKDSGLDTVTYAEALDQALCFGWIDGQKKPYDADSWLQKFTPRRAKSGWSKINTQHAARLIESGEMTSAGLKEIDAAKADGRWNAAYDSFANAAVPEDLVDHYERIAKRHGGIALAEVRGEGCGQCGVHIRPHVIQQIERPTNEELFHCETCTRILYYSAHNVAQAPASATAPTHES